MGQVLFWLEAAIASVLFVALGVGIVWRTRRPGRRWAIRIAWWCLTVVPWLLAVGAFAAVQIWAGGALFPLISSSAACVAFIVGAIIVIRRGRRPSPSANGPAATAWRLGRLSLAWAVALLLACMTFWNLDLAVRQQMATMRVEAGAVALSVSPPRVPDSQNAAVLYRQALDILDARKDISGDWKTAVSNWLRPEAKLDDPKMLNFLGEQRPVINLLRKAGELPSCNFGLEYNPPSITLVLQQLTRMRELARLFALSSRAAAYQGRLTDAAKDLSAGFTLANHITADPPLIALLVGVASEQQAFESLQYLLDHGPLTDQALEALRLDSTMDFNAALHRTMRMETIAVLSIFTLTNPAVELASPGLPGPCSAAPYRVFLWEEDVAAYLRWTRRLEEISAQPFYQNAREWQNPPVGYGWHRKGGLLASVFTPTYSSPGEHAAQADVQHRLAMLAVAMWRYRLAKGAFPADLNLLVPDYILIVPLDPFTGQGMKLANTDVGVVIYSVGPDLKDDGGKPLNKEKTRGDIPLVLGRP